MKLNIILNESRESTDDLPASSLLRLHAAPHAGLLLRPGLGIASLCTLLARIKGKLNFGNYACSLFAVCTTAAS